MTTYRDILKQVGWPTRAVVVDFETFFDANYTLKKMSSIEYIEDPRFDWLSVGLKSLAEPMPGGFERYFEKPEIVDGTFKQFITGPWFGRFAHNVTWLIQNARFDAVVFKQKFGLVPPFILDLIDIDRQLSPRSPHDLGSMAEAEDLIPKGETAQFKGVTWEGMGDSQRENLRVYNLRDCRAEAELFKRKIPLIEAPTTEIPLMRHTLKMCLNAQLDFDFKLAGELVRDMTGEARSHTRITGLTETQLRSRDAFGEALQAALPEGEKMPTKIGKKGLIPALAQGDDGLKWLLGHKIERVRDLTEARVAVRSWPTHIKRVLRMTAQAKALGGKIWVPLKYFGGHTGRWSGDMRINAQNLGGKGRGKANHPLIGRMRGLFMAPKGEKLVVVDLAQIEARMLAWMAGQDDLLRGFMAGSDIYSDFATTLFGHEVRKPRDTDPPEVAKRFSIERGFGKDAILGCVAFGTPVLTDNGWRLIEQVSSQDRLWDGNKWVYHCGVVYRGKKQCINVSGVWMTPEHEVWQPDGWTTAQELSTLSRPLGQYTGLYSLPASSEVPVVGLSPSNAVALAIESLLHQGIIWSQENLHAVMCVLKQHPAKLRAIARLYRNRIDLGCLIEFVRRLVDVRQDRINTMVNEVLECGPHGSQIEMLFLNTWSRCLVGTTHDLTSTGLTTTEDMNLEISDSLPGSKICETADILYSGNCRRYQVGGLLVANCGYGMGADKFYDRCRANDSLRPLFDSGQYDKGLIERLIKTYRTKYSKIPALWRETEKAFLFVTKYPARECSVPMTHGQLDFFHVGQETRIRLPSGRTLKYKWARVVSLPEDRSPSLVYKDGPLWGGSIVENIDQAMSRDVLALAILDVEANGTNVVLHCHDEIVGCVREAWADDALELITASMTAVPEWACGLPLAAEGKIAGVYCK